MRASLVALSLLVGCSGGDDVSLDGSPTHTEETSDCAGADVFTIGMTATSDRTGSVVALLQAAPVPPDVGDNTWTIEVVDAGSAAVTGLSVAVTPWMPLHGHGLSPADYLGTDMGDGRYELETFDLIMPGLWEFTIDLDFGGEPDTVKFSFCAEG